jgi:hypothetical protein
MISRKFLLLIIIIIILGITPLIFLVFSADAVYATTTTTATPVPAAAIITQEGTGKIINIPFSGHSPHLKVDFHVLREDLKCSVDSPNEMVNLITYTDKAGNTVDIYCGPSPWLQPHERQYVAYYNPGNIIIGLCPYDEAINAHQIYTNSEGVINATSWLSVSKDGKYSVEYHNKFNQFDQPPSSTSS